MSWRHTKVYQHRRGGVSYFRLRTGFSINEGQFPNITIIWGGWVGKMFYVAFSHRFKWYWTRP